MARGCDLAFGEDRLLVRVEGVQPSGARDVGRVPVVNIPCYIAMKGIVLGRRKKPKDAYDLYYIIKHGPDGPHGAARAVRPRRNHGLVSEGIATGITPEAAMKAGLDQSNTTFGAIVVVTGILATLEFGSRWDSMAVLVYFYHHFHQGHQHWERNLSRDFAAHFLRVLPRNSRQGKSL